MAPTKTAEKQAADAEKQRFNEWVALQKEEGHEVIGDSFDNAYVVGLDQGPTYNDNPGGVKP